MPANPFRIHGTVVRPEFMNREDELARIARTLREPGAKLLVYGERRIGKTSALAVALADLTREGGLGLMADFSTASTVIDMANRVLDAATRALGRRWQDVAADLIRRIGLKIAFETDPVTGFPTASLDLGLRQAPLDEQYASLGRVLDSLERMAEERGTPLAVVLDEFQEIHRFGGETAEWQLRGTIQHHRHLSYVLAGSKPHLIRRMLGKGRAFYGLLDKLAFGPIGEDELAGWIDERLEAAGIMSEGAGRHIVRIAGPRTRDVVQLAREAFELARLSGAAEIATVERAFVEVVQAEDDPIRTFWEGLTPHQQNVLRAVAASAEGLTTAGTLKRFSLPSSAAVSQTASKFVEEGVLEKGGPSGYRFDNPFVRGWIVLHALPDLGLWHPPTFQPRKDAPSA